MLVKVRCADCGHWSIDLLMQDDPCHPGHSHDGQDCAGRIFRVTELSRCACPFSDRWPCFVVGDLYRLSDESLSETDSTERAPRERELTNAKG
jgi:hypothetical protein